MRAVVVGVISAILTYLAMVLVFGLGLTDAMYISLTIATAAASAIALSEREANLGVVSGFVAIAIIATLAKYVMQLDIGAILVKLPSAEVVIPTDVLPYFAVAFVGFLAFARALNWSVGRTMLFVIGSIAWVAYFAVADAFARLVALTIIAICAAMPLVAYEEKSRLLAVVPTPIVATVNLSYFDVGGLFVLPLLFVAVDPTGRINRMARDLAAIAILALLLVQLVGVSLSI
ncbi:MAG: hypothetical protein NWE95_01960 [Candidatus Bathyarchaeota archaeon]|nr:hypothetical protein [Candidatus Bathyarchaeota archaeon]